MTRDELIDLLRSEAEPDDQVLFWNGDPNDGYRKPSGVLFVVSAEAVVLETEKA